MSLFTSNKHPRRTSVACERIAPPFYLFPSPPPVPQSSLSRRLVAPLNSTHRQLLLSRVFVRMRSISLRNHIYIFFIFVFTQATRYFLIILLIDTSFLLLLPRSPFSRSGRARISHENDPHTSIYRLSLSFPQSFGKSPPLVVPPPPVGFSLPKNHHPLLASFYVLAAGGKSTARYPPEIMNIQHRPPPTCLPLPLPFNPLPFLLSYYLCTSIYSQKTYASGKTSKIEKSQCVRNPSE